MNTISYLSGKRKNVNRARAAVLAAALFAVALAIVSCTERGTGGKSSAETFNDPAAGAVYDLYVMSMCPYGFNAVADLSDMVHAFPNRVLNIWFIGRAEGDKLTSLRGEQEVVDETLWLGVQALYPARYREFLSLRGPSRAPTDDLLKQMKLDVEKIHAWAADQGRAELREHYVRSVEKNVSASPTLFVNNNRYTGPMGGGRLVRDMCRAVDPQPQFCREYPECSEDAHCYMQGKLAKCVNPGQGGKERATCEFWDDTAFTLTVLVADSSRDYPERSVIDWIVRTLPGAKVNTVNFSSDDGRRLTAAHNPSALPFIHFEKKAEEAYQFATIRERLDVAADGGYRLKAGFVRANYFPLRPEKLGLIEVYVDPLMPSIGVVVNAVMSDSGRSKRVVLRPTLTGAPSGQGGPQNNHPALNKLRSEEALRWIVLEEEFPKSYGPYLEQYVNNPGSTYWFDWLKGPNVSYDSFSRRINANQRKMAPYREELAVISSGEQLMVMVNNRTKITVPTERMLAQILKSIP
jgi:hypothetical protein